MPEFSSQIPKKGIRCGQRGESYTQLNILQAIDRFGSTPLLCNGTSAREVVAVVVVGVIIAKIIIVIIILKITKVKNMFYF